jgi:alpha-tubulin suppressor-like RCC1 family protein
MPRSYYALPGIALLIALASCSEPTTPEPDKSQAAEPALVAAAAALSFYQVSAGDYHTCAITTDHRPYCWGSGLLGDGKPSRDYQERPGAVSGGLRLLQVSAGGLGHMCGVTTAYRAYCWGGNSSGELGDGTNTDRLTPVPVAGGHRFYHVDASGDHTCGLSYPDKLVYCWGFNGTGELGDGSTTSRKMPTRVAGGRQFRQVTTGFAHSCGVTPTGPAYCWGWNKYGQTGDGDASTAQVHLTPVLVAGGKRYLQIDAGDVHTCAVTTDHRAYCWGNGTRGQVGDGKTYLRFAPRAVAGGLSFDRVSAGDAETCGETTGNRAYCWGDNTQGGLGDGTRTRRLTPVAVAGGLLFSQVSAGTGYGCGKTDAGVGYCWGYNQEAELGDGTRTNRSRPVRVVGPM